MSNFDKRLTKLEQRTGTTRYIIAYPHDDNRIRVQESGKPEDTAVIMNEQDFQTWQASQPDNVLVIRIVYPEDDTLNHGYRDYQ